MDRKAMTNEENYHFDVAGYLIIPGVLSATKLKACNKALDQAKPGDDTLSSSKPLLALRDHPVLLRYLEQICGEGFRLDQAPRLIGLWPPTRASFFRGLISGGGGSVAGWLGS